MTAPSPLTQTLRTVFGGGAVPTPISSVTPDDTSISDHLAVLDEVLTQVEQQALATPVPVTPVSSVISTTQVSAEENNLSSLPQALPVAVNQAAATFHNPPTPAAASKKEALDRGAVFEAAQVDAGAGGLQILEQGPVSPEISPEVEEYIQEIKTHQQQQPHEVVIADGTLQLQPILPSIQKVIVLPITPAEEAVGAKKSSKWSVRWLVEWSRKLMKMFSGKIVYREV